MRRNITMALAVGITISATVACRQQATQPPQIAEGEWLDNVGSSGNMAGGYNPYHADDDIQWLQQPPWERHHADNLKQLPSEVPPWERALPVPAPKVPPPTVCLSDCVRGNCLMICSP